MTAERPDRPDGPPGEDLPLGRFIARRRDELGISQEKLARLLKIERSALSRWERGRHTPSDRYLRLLARHLKVSLEDLKRPRPHEAEYRRLEDRIAALEAEVFGNAQET